MDIIQSAINILPIDAMRRSDFRMLCISERMAHGVCSVCEQHVFVEARVYACDMENRARAD